MTTHSSRPALYSSWYSSAACSFAENASSASNDRGNGSPGWGGKEPTRGSRVVAAAGGRQAAPPPPVWVSMSRRGSAAARSGGGDADRRAAGWHGSRIHVATGAGGGLRGANRRTASWHGPWQLHTRSRSRSARRLSLRPSRAPASVFGGVGGGGLRLTGRLGAFARGEGVCGGRGTFGCVFYWSKRACRGSGLSRGSLVRRSRVGRFEIWENDID